MAVSVERALRTPKDSEQGDVHTSRALAYIIRACICVGQTEAHARNNHDGQSTQGALTLPHTFTYSTMSRPRQSSMGGTQRRMKAHIPFRADDQRVGKKTGMSVGVVDRHSDGFESFGEVLGQADEHTPVRVRGKRKSMRSPTPDDDEETEDEDGEMSMELDDRKHAKLLVLGWRLIPSSDSQPSLMQSGAMRHLERLTEQQDLATLPAQTAQ